MTSAQLRDHYNYYTIKKFPNNYTTSYNQRTIERSQDAAYIIMFFRGAVKYVQGPGRVLEGWDPKSEGFPGKRGRPRPVELSVLAPRLF